jgi:alkylation response protein AidB-like acyl-CoA dehydrogenase
MATPALARFGSHELKMEFLAPSIAGDIVACLGVSEAGSGSDVASVQTTALPKKGWQETVIMDEGRGLRRGGAMGDVCGCREKVWVEM